jgi:PAS domain S-box-containing protein
MKDDSGRKYLRKKGEKKFFEKTEVSQKISSVDMEKLIHDLQVHQNELEARNEELRKAKVDQQEGREYLRLAQRAANARAWNWNIVTGELKWAEEFYAAYGLGNSSRPYYEDWLRTIHPEDRERVDKSLGEAINNKGEIDVEYRTILPDGTIRWLNAKGQTIYDETNGPIRMVGITLDITERKLAEAALWRSQQLFADIFRVSPAATILSSLADGRCVDANEGYARLTGYTREELLGKTTVELGIWLSAEERHRVVTELAQKGNLENVELTLRRKNGEFINTLSSGEVITLDGQRFILSFFFDITEHKRAEEVLRESEERFRAIFEGNTDGLLIVDPRNKAFVMGNPAICRMLGCRLEEIPTMGVADIHRQEDMPFVLDHFEHLVSGREITGKDVPVKRKDGSVFFADVTANLITLSGKTYVVGSFRDITERKRAEDEIRRSRDELEFRVQERTKELAQSQARLQNLASQLLLAQEKERKRVAVELHDGLMSELAATKFLLEAKIKVLDNGKTIEPAELRRIAEVLAGTMKEARTIMNNLHPSLLDELGLIATIRWLCGEFQKSYPHIAVQQEILVSEGDISRGIRVVIYRILQEALNNFARHGNGDRVQVFLSKSDGTFSLVIRDNGQGFDVGMAEKGLGLESMRERVMLSGGDFQLESSIGRGTTIRAIWRT